MLEHDVQQRRLASELRAEQHVGLLGVEAGDLQAGVLQRQAVPVDARD